MASVEVFVLSFFLFSLDFLYQYYRNYSANACLMPVCSAHGLAITTVEGIGSIKNGLHPVQVCEHYLLKGHL